MYSFINNFDVTSWAPHQLVFPYVAKKPYKEKSNERGQQTDGGEKKVILFTWPPTTTAAIIGDRIRSWAPPDHLQLSRHPPNQRSNENKCLLASWGFVFNLNEFSR